MHSKGTILKDRYQIRSLIGNGGSGYVYLAIDLNIGKRWAIKQIFTDISFGSELAESEIKMLRNLEYPMFPRITDAWQEMDCCYIVSDYIEGISLKQIISEKLFSQKETIYIMRQVAMAIDYLHGQDPPILYLDLKPDNILIRADGRAFLVDFGISRIRSVQGMSFGTPGYAAPEQYDLTKQSVISEKTDVFAFGNTYFNMRTGINPDSDAHMMSHLVCQCKLIAPKEKKLILNCIRTAPDERIKSMKHIIRQLDHISFYSRKALSKSVLLLTTVLLTTIICIFAWKKASEVSASSQIMVDVSEYMEDGEYTKEGLKVLVHYINSGQLNYEETQYYTFEIARTYFESFGDYREAERYFDMLDENAYPQKAYYIKLCRFQNGFDYDISEVQECLDKFYESVLMMPDEKEKYNNLLFVAFCYGNYMSENDNNRLKEKDILKKTCKSLEVMRSERNDPWIEMLLLECNRRIELENNI